MTDVNRNTSKIGGFAFALVVLMAGIGIALWRGAPPHMAVPVSWSTER